MADFNPDKDGDLNSWQQHFLTVVNANDSAFGLIPSDSTPLTSGQATWSLALTELKAAQAATATRQTKVAARNAFEATIPAVAAKVRANPAVTDASKAAAGLPE